MPATLKDGPKRATRGKGEQAQRPREPSSPHQGGESRDGQADNLVEESPVLLFSLGQTQRRRERMEKQFDELAAAILFDGAVRHKVVSSLERGFAEGGESDEGVPTLHVGFIARAMGLNLSNEQVITLVELVEDKTASYGYVSYHLLKAVIIDTLLTGLLGGTTLAEAGIIPQKHLPRTPSSCRRADEATIYQAFCAIDTEKKGFLTEEELRAALTGMGEGLSAEEMEDVLLASLDPETGCVQYADYADVLAHE